MADVAVVGAGLGGLATAARLAKLGHRVTVYERDGAPGGLLGQIRHDGLVWDAVPLQTTIPAVLRDLFRKSGRPLERYVDLQLSTPARRHVFADGTTLDLPTGSRGAQLDGVSDALGAAAGEAWTRFVDAQADSWALLRSEVLDPPNGVVALTDRRLSRALNLRQSLDRLLRKVFDDERLRQLALYGAIHSGGDTSAQPAFRSVQPYTERVFGVWRAPGGAADLVRALLKRMDERSVEIRFDTEVSALRTDADRVNGLELGDGSGIETDIVVTAVSPDQVFAGLLDHRVSRTAATTLAPAHPVGTRTVSHLGFGCPVPAAATEVVLHGSPMLVVTTGSHDGAPSSTWTVTSLGPATGDVLDTMAQRGVDVRPLVTTRLDRSRRVEPTWDGARRAAGRAALSRPLPGLHCLGTSLVLGSSVPYVAWQAAHIAAVIGKA